MRQKRSLSSKLFSKMLCVVLSLCLLLAGFSPAFAEDDPVQRNPFQEVLFKAMSLDNAEREVFVKDVLLPLDELADGEEIPEGVVDAVKEYFPMISEEDINEGLKVYVSTNKKEEIKDAILTIDLSRELNIPEGLEGLVEEINFRATGDKENMQGITLLVEILNKIQQQMPSDSNAVIVIDDPEDTSKIKFSIPAVLISAVRDRVNALLPHIETLYNKINEPAYEGKDAFERLLNYAETTANSFDPQQIDAFKGFLAANGGIYKGESSDLNPLQVVMLRAMTMTAQQKEAFIEKVLVPLDEEASVVTPEVIIAAKSFFPTVSEQDIERGLGVYAEIGPSRKTALKDAIKEINLSRELISVDGFEGISEKINYQVTGDKDDMRGLVLLVEILNRVQEQLPEDADRILVIDDEEESWKLKFNIPVTLQEMVREHVNALLPHIETLYNKINEPEYQGKDAFESLLNYAEITANSFGAKEVDAFKEFLNANGGIYDPFIFDIKTTFLIDDEPADTLKEDGILTAEVEAYNKSNKAVDALVIVALYNSEETMTATAYITKKIPARDTQNISGGFRLPPDVEGYEVRVFVWEGTDIENTSMNPLSDISIISANK